MPGPPPAQPAPGPGAPDPAPALALAGLQPPPDAASPAPGTASPGDPLAADLLTRGPEARALAPVARSGALLSRQRGGDLADLRVAGLALRRPPAGLASPGEPAEEKDQGTGPGDDRPRVLTYIVQEGDTLWDIALRFRTDTDTLAASNPDLDPDLLQPGQKLTVLANATGLIYKVQPGDTLSDLAARYSVPEAEIVRVNGIEDPSRLPVGLQLILPGAKVPRPAAPRAAASRSEGWIWPVRGPITSRFGPRWGEFHAGLDIGASRGTPVVAVRSGRVVQAGWNGNYGYSVLIDHGDGTQARYAHASRLLVEKGQWVRQGETILLVGSTGRSTGPHLHLEILVNGRPQDPLKFLP
nr:MAG: peptidase M23 [Bacillota bacterium]